MRNKQPIDDCECRDILIAVENFGQLALEAADVQLEVVPLSHFNGEKVMVIFLGLSAGGILSE